MKREHSQLSHEAHECVDSIPELNNMVSGVQALGMFERIDYTLIHGNIIILLDFVN